MVVFFIFSRHITIYYMVTENKKKSLGGRTSLSWTSKFWLFGDFISKNKNVHSKAADEAIVDFKILKSYYDVFLKKQKHTKGGRGRGYRRLLFWHQVCWAQGRCQVFLVSFCYLLGLFDTYRGKRYASKYSASDLC